MRLIDADNIISVCEILSEKGNDPHYWGQLISIIKDVPTIDAIPVEWLNKQCEMADDRGDMEMTDAISWLIQTWHEEQEAR